MAHRSPLTAARHHPSLTFGLSGGLFALAFVGVTSAQQLLGNGVPFRPSSVDLILVVGGFPGGALVSRLLWARLDGARSPRRGAAVGALVGLLALAVPFYLFELSTVFYGLPADANPTVTPWSRVASYLGLLLITPLVLGLLSAVITRGGTVVVGATVGYLLASR